MERLGGGFLQQVCGDREKELIRYIGFIKSKGTSSFRSSIGFLFIVI